MASETVMYMSLLLIGMFAFGFFSFTFSNYTGLADEQTADSNLTDILTKVALRIEGLLSSANELKGTGSANSFIGLSSTLDVPAKLNGETYEVFFSVDGANVVYLNAKVSLQRLVETSVSLGVTNSSVTFHGSFSSTSTVSPLLQYNFDVNAGSESIRLSN